MHNSEMAVGVHLTTGKWQASVGVGPRRCLRLSTVVLMTISNLGRKGFAWLRLPWHGPWLREAGKAGAGAEAVEDAASWLAPHGLLTLPASGPHADSTYGPPAQEWPRPQRAGLSHINH